MTTTTTTTEAIDAAQQGYDEAAAALTAAQRELTAILEDNAGLPDRMIQGDETVTAEVLALSGPRAQAAETIVNARRNRVVLAAKALRQVKAEDLRARISDGSLGLLSPADLDAELEAISRATWAKLTKLAAKVEASNDAVHQVRDLVKAHDLPGVDVRSDQVFGVVLTAADGTEYYSHPSRSLGEDISSRLSTMQADANDAQRAPTPGLAQIAMMTDFPFLIN